MRGKQIGLVVVLLMSVVFAPVWAEPPSLLPWTSPPFTSADIAALTTELDKLESILTDQTLGSQQLAKGSWDSHAFAQYTGGVLAGLGYEVRVATDPHWPSGSHSWILVSLATSEGMPVWVPIETAPPLGSRQITLGTVPVQSVSSTEIAFDPRYGSFENAAELASNHQPAARIRFAGSTVTVDTPFVILALGSNDNDGEIVIYRWQVGDGEWLATRSWSTTTTVTTVGPTTIKLQVIDNQGASATTTISVRSEPAETPEPNTGSGCGCS